MIVTQVEFDFAVQEELHHLHMSAGTRDVERCSVTGREREGGFLKGSGLSSARRDGHNATRFRV